jgi:hypothetical protein
MALTVYVPIDDRRYKKHEQSVPFSPSLAPGDYVYVQDCWGVVWVIPDGPHRHPQVLGGARPAVAAGELTLGDNGEVLMINNVSGTFQCAPDSLLTAVGGLIRQGATVSRQAIVEREA